MNTLNTLKYTGLIFSVGALGVLLVLLILQNAKGNLEENSPINIAHVEQAIGNDYAGIMRSFYRSWQENKGSSAISSSGIVANVEGASVVHTEKVLKNTNVEDSLITDSFERGAW